MWLTLRCNRNCYLPITAVKQSRWHNVVPHQ